MSFQTNQLKYAFGLGGLMSFYGIVGIIVLMMPANAMGNNTKIVTIVLVLLTLPFALLLMFLAARRSKKKARKAEEEKQAAQAAQAGGAENGAPQPQKVAAATGQYPELVRGTEETVQFLKSSNLGESGRDAVYALPWYLVAADRGRGKALL